MGLGKTVQAIAFLLARRAARPDDPRPALVVCPTSVVGNWERELARFGPSLPVVRHHGPDRSRSPSAFTAPPHAVVVTTYALLCRDHALLGEIDWAAAILDEAQNIKNAVAHQAVAARALRASHRFALTGTPVENRLAELWSILEFCVPGLLGPKATVLAALRRLRATAAEPAPKPPRRPRATSAAVSLRRVSPAAYAGFQAPVGDLRFRIEAPAVAGAILRQLGTPASWRLAATPRELLQPVVARAAALARELALEPPAEPPAGWRPPGPSCGPAIAGGSRASAAARRWRGLSR